MTTQEKEILENEGYEFISEFYLIQPSGRKEKRIEIKHTLCGKKYDVRPSRFFGEGQRCTCLRKRKDAKIKDTIDFQNFIINHERFGPEYKVIGEYLGRKMPIRMKHLKCGKEYDVARAEYILAGDNGGKCPICHRCGKRDEAILYEKLKNVGADITLLEPYETGKNKYLVKNNKCGHEYTTFISDILSSKKTHCLVCENKSPKNITIDTVKEEFLQLDPNYEILSDTYISTHEHLLVRHNICGHEYTVSRNNFVIVGRRCPFCSKSRGMSNEEIEVKEYLDKLGFKSIKKRIRDTQTGGSKEIDILLEDKNLGFEFDGLYWHSEDKDKISLLEKTNFFANHGISIIHIFEDEWKYNKRKTKEKINAVLNNKLICYFDHSEKIIDSISEIPSDVDEFYIDRRWYVEGQIDGDNNSFELDEILPPKKFYLDVSCNKRSEVDLLEKTWSTIVDCGYYKYKRKKE